MNKIGTVLAFAAVLALPAAAQDVPQAKVAQGALTGFVDHGAEAFLDIPFATAPVGARRWAAPLAPPAWRGVRDATKFGPACMQPDAKPGGPWSSEYFVDGPYSEDCLTVNVWTTPGKGKAVVLFIPGGGFNQGGGGVPIYNGASMAKAGVVFVSMNYRLSAAGFLTHPALTAADGHSGDYGLMDAIAALQWIKANIAAFGGDPAKVTVMGQSAGAGAIVALLHSPQAAGLFRAAIIDSGVRAGSKLPTTAEREQWGTGWATARHAATLSELKSLTSADLVPEKGTPFRFGPVTDGAVVPDSAGPIVNDVPILTGWNAGEGAAPPGKLLNQPVSRGEFQSWAKSLPGLDADAVLAAYPSGDDASAAMHEAGHDAMMESGAGWAASRGGKAALYYYDFEHVMPGDTARTYGSYHSSELPYVFDTLHTLTQRRFGPDDARVSAILQAYWVNFIKTGDPNSSDLPHWTVFDPAANSVMALGLEPHMRPITTPQKAAALSRH
jgi:para-nitrobenzyl esterase